MCPFEDLGRFSGKPRSAKFRRVVFQDWTPFYWLGSPLKPQKRGVPSLPNERLAEKNGRTSCVPSALNRSQPNPNALKRSQPNKRLTSRNSGREYPKERQTPVLRSPSDPRPSCVARLRREPPRRISTFTSAVLRLGAPLFGAVLRLGQRRPGTPTCGVPIFLFMFFIFFGGGCKEER